MWTEANEGKRSDIKANTISSAKLPRFMIMPMQFLHFYLHAVAPAACKLK